MNDKKYSLEEIQALLNQVLTPDKGVVDTNTSKGQETDSSNSTSNGEERASGTQSQEQSDNDKKEINNKSDETQERLSALEASLKQKDDRILELTNTITELKNGLSSGKKQTQEKEKPSIYRQVILGQH